jgi:hypothetical protein
MINVKDGTKPEIAFFLFKIVFFFVRALKLVQYQGLLTKQKLHFFVFASVCWFKVGDLVSILPTVHKQLLTKQIPKAQKKTDNLTVLFYAFGICRRKSCWWNIDEIDPLNTSKMPIPCQEQKIQTVFL